MQVYTGHQIEIKLGDLCQSSIMGDIYLKVYSIPITRHWFVSKYCHKLIRCLPFLISDSLAINIHNCSDHHTKNIYGNLPNNTKMSITAQRSPIILHLMAHSLYEKCV